MDQTNLLSTVLAGDPAALEQLYRTQLPVIRSLLREHGGAEADTKDIFQDAVLVLYQKAKKPDFQLTSQFGTFFYGICRNLLLNRRTKKFVSSEVTIAEYDQYTADDTSFEAALLQVERDDLFWYAFRQLGEDCQKLLELFFQKMPMNVITVQMGFGSEGYTRRRKRQCKDRLVELVKSNPAYQELIGT